jgi:hypothetical protein
MAYTFHIPFSDEAIVLSEFIDSVDADQMRQWWLDMIANVHGLDAPLAYLVMDVRRSSASFESIFGMFRDGTVQNALMMLNGIELVSMLVGDTAMARLASSMSKQLGLANIPIFRSLEDAHEFIAVDLARRVTA